MNQVCEKYKITFTRRPGSCDQCGLPRRAHESHEFSRENDLGPGFGYCMVCGRSKDDKIHEVGLAGAW